MPTGREPSIDLTNFQEEEEKVAMDLREATALLWGEQG